MDKINIDGFLKDIEGQVKNLAQQQLKQYSQQAIDAVKSSLNDGKDDLQRWVEELASGEIDKDGFDSLVRGQLDLAKMEALKQAGLAAVQIQSFVNGVIDIVVNAAFAAVKIP
jgi:hypothetical protein